MPPSKPPHRYILAASARSKPGLTVWGLTLECGHYVERVSQPPNPVTKEPRARCDDCGKDAPPVAPELVKCETCASYTTTNEGREYGHTGCPACHGFGKVERVLQPHDLLTGPGPGQEVGDHVLAVWMANLGGDLLTTTIAKRGRAYVGEHVRMFQGDPAETINMELVEQNPATHLEHGPDGMAIIRDRFFPNSNLSAEFLMEDANGAFNSTFEAAAQGPGDYRQVYYQARTTHRLKVNEMKERFLGIITGEDK